MRDTIVALATARAVSAVAIVRVSGSALHRFVHDLVGTVPVPRQATVVKVYDEWQEVLDVGLGLFFPSPQSYTGEDVFEFQGHGGLLLMDQVLKRCMALGARLAEPGEFTQRAFLNQKMDLTQAEAVADLINAASDGQRKAAMRSLSGTFRMLIEECQHSCLQMRVAVEAHIDFSDQEIEELPILPQELHDLSERLNAICQSAVSGARLRTGIRVALVGPRNAGKSSLFNVLVAEEVAIVAPIAGTTRDVIRETIFHHGVPIHLADTAGLCAHTDDVVEQMGLDRTKIETTRADVVLFVLDSEHLEQEQLLLQHVPPNQYVIVVVNKIDLVSQPARMEKRSDFLYRVWVSAMTQDGCAAIMDHICTMVMPPVSDGEVLLARERHLVALRAARDCLLRAQQPQLPLELLAEELRLAAAQLGSVVGQYSSDDLLGEIFTQFCIGK